MLDGSSEIAIGQLQDCIKRGEEASLTMTKIEIKKPYISDKTHDLIVERQKATDEKDGNKDKILHKKIENAVKQYKRDFWAQQLEKESWKGVKSTKRALFPNSRGLSTWTVEWPDLTKKQMFWPTTSNKFNGAE
jgi:hypothetical protein